MDELPNSLLRGVEKRLGAIASQLARIQFSRFQPSGGWSPPVNAYRCRDGFAICVDLAGVDREQIELSIERQRLLIRGQRMPAEPGSSEGPPLQVLALEIDHGPFERELALPEEVETDRVEVEQRNGLLWVYLKVLK